MQDTRMLAKKARQAAIPLAATAFDIRNKALLLMAEVLEERKETIEKANMADMEQAALEGLAEPLKKRLRFDEKNGWMFRPGCGHWRNCPTLSGIPSCPGNCPKA